jgi:hypothetical protein
LTKEKIENSYDPPIVYWDHEEEECYFIAENFIDYLAKITALKCIEPAFGYRPAYFPFHPYYSLNQILPGGI